MFLLTLAPVIWLWRVGRSPFRHRREVASLMLRVAILVLVVLGLAGLQWVRVSDELAVVFLLDVSDSVDAEARAEAVAFIRASLAEMGPNDRAALVLFGADALVDRPLSGAKELGGLFSIPATAHTDVGEAVRLGLALLPATADRRLVLLSDGLANVSGGEAAARLAAASGVELDAVPMPARSGDEAWVDAVDVPQVLYEGESFSVLVRVQSAVEQMALLRLYAERRLVAEEAILLHPGLNSYLFPLSAGDPGFSTFVAQLVPEADVFYQNNVLGAFALVHGAPRVLVIAPPEFEDETSGATIDEGAALSLALERAGLYVERATPVYLPSDLATLGEYASVVLVNVAAPDLARRQMEALQAYVRDLGRGLVCVGGETSYGVGGYYKTPLEEMLPVEMTIKDKERMPPLAIVFVVDKSGSMDMAASQGGTRKIDLVREAVIRSLDLLNAGDQVGVVAFESTAKWVWPLAEFTAPADVQQQVATIRAAGGTDIYAGLNAAVAALETSKAQLKHVILLTDGGASQEGLHDLVARLQAANGTLSAIGVGQDAAPFLRPLAVEGGGRYHYTDNPATIPQIFVQETTLAQRAYIVEEMFYPVLTGRSAILDGIESSPALHGYVAVSIKPAAQMILASARDDPVLAQWQYGLGRSVAWTSDAKGRWAREWVRWEQFPRFWAQAVRWTIVERGDQSLDVQIVDEGERVRVVVDVIEAQGEYGNNLVTEAHFVAPSMRGETLSLQQTAPGRYEGTLELMEEGTFLVRVVAVPPDAPALTQVTGFVRTFSPEYRSFGTDEAALRHLAEVGEGRVLSDPAEAFARRADREVPRTYTDVWPWLLGAAICLFPVDVGVRRLAVEFRGMHTLREIYGRAARRMAGRQHRASGRARPSARMARLLAAKERAPMGPEGSPVLEGGGDASPVTASTAEVRPLGQGTGRDVGLSEDEVPAAGGPPESGVPDREEMTSRLLAAKRRARRQSDE